ncbi:hypothetical protein [Vibrio agarivorans]|uniref:hypothetical protein n=1 Tax=Vibrio agarivorans TaxID=153622 RepID=UPI0025B282ED|nr:hypothetical protein [Vibrio agarivorans]MDN3661169.1 hypothetical protein [Vibrio agarivorans]
MQMEYGEVVQVFSHNAQLQLQRHVVQRKSEVLHTVRITLAPRQHSQTDFSKKIIMDLEEHQLSTLCLSLMGLIKNNKIDGVKGEGRNNKIAYININPDETININISNDTGKRQSLSIVFGQEHRYKLLRLAVTQLTKNSVGYKQTVGDTLNILKASVIGSVKR